MHTIRCFLAFVIVTVCILSVNCGHPGGVGPEQKITDEITQIALSLREDVESKAGFAFAKYEPISYASQVVSGVNYFIKVDVGSQLIIVRVYKSFSGTVELHSVNAANVGREGIAYFDCSEHGVCSD